MSLNLREMLIGTPARLRWVYRYSTCRIRHPESVAEHSYFVAFYAMQIAHWAEHQQADEPAHQLNVRMDVLLQRAIVHDLEEAVSGDFPRSFKHSSKQLKETLDRVGHNAFEHLVNKLWQGAEVRGYITRLWDKAKARDVEGRILEFADFLSVLAFLAQEGQGEGNGTIGIHVAGMPEYYEKFKGPDYDFIRPLVQQAGEMLNEVLR